MKTKRCPKCEQELSIDAFGKNRSRKDGLQVYCKGCCKECCRDRYSRNLEEYRQRGREYYREHRDECLRQKRRYSEKNRDGLARRGREYRGTIVGHLYNTFSNINQRCNNPVARNACYKGVQNKFKSLDDFRDYVINELQVDPRGLQIDRIDGDGHYERGNIRFVTAEVNNKNRRNIKVVA